MYLNKYLKYKNKYLNNKVGGGVGSYTKATQQETFKVIDTYCKNICNKLDAIIKNFDNFEKISDNLLQKEWFANFIVNEINKLIEWNKNQFNQDKFLHMKVEESTFSCISTQVNAIHEKVKELHYNLSNLTPTSIKYIKDSVQKVRDNIHNSTWNELSV